MRVKAIRPERAPTQEAVRGCRTAMSHRAGTAARYRRAGVTIIPERELIPWEELDMRPPMLAMTLVLLSGCSGADTRPDATGCPHVEMRYTGESQRFERGRIGFFNLTNHGPGRIRFNLWTQREALLFGHPVEVEALTDGQWAPVVVTLSEYAPAPFELSLGPGESQKVSVSDPLAEGSVFVSEHGSPDGPIRVRLKDNAFKCTFWSETFVPG